MKKALIAMAALTLATVTVQAHANDAQLVLISGVHAQWKYGGDVISKVTRTMPTMQECVEAGKAWMREKDVGSGNGWRRYECFQEF